MSENKKTIKITYTTLAIANEELHTLYEEAVAQIKANVRKKYPNLINGQEVYSRNNRPGLSPVDSSIVLSFFPQATVQEVDQAVSAARCAYDSWRRTPWQERVAFLRKAAALIEERIFSIAAVLSLEVGKNRLEAIGEVQETADLVYYVCDDMEKNVGFIRNLINESPRHHNRSILKPFGPWSIISPFNYPAALTGGPAGAALVAGNTVIIKPASVTPLTAYLVTRCFADVLPPGVVNFITGSGDIVGEAIAYHPQIAGVTFTGSSDIGMRLVASFAAGGAWTRPCVVEMGGKNATIITESADLHKAVAGTCRSAFGFGGQKCSAGSRIFVHRAIHEKFLCMFQDYASKLIIGDPTLRSTFAGPQIDKAAAERYEAVVVEARRDGTVLMGGEKLCGGIYDKGYYLAPTVVTHLKPDHRLCREEVFLPFVTVCVYDHIDEAIKWANSVNYGLTAGVFAGTQEEIDYILADVEAGVVYVNKESGATTGAWPGYQAFGGWKRSTSTNKGAGNVYYLTQYMREQSQTIIE